MKAVILGDTHLGGGQRLGKTGIGSNLNSRVADQVGLLEFVLDQTIQHEADAIIITGDIFEEPKPHPSLIALFIGWIKKCQAHHIQVHIVLGNHDLLRSGNIFTSSLDVISEMELENCHIYKQIDTFVLGTTAFTILPFRDRRSFNVTSNAEALSLLQNAILYELISIPPIYKKIVIGHLAIEGSIPAGNEIDDLANEIFCPLSMFAGYDYVWMGHVHKAQVMQCEKPYITHIGSMDISNFGETDQKKHIVIIDCDAQSQGFDIVFLPTRPLLKLSITVPNDIEDATTYVMYELKKQGDDINFDRSIVRLEILLASPELKPVNKSDLERVLLEQGAFNIVSITESKKIAHIKKEIENSLNSKMDVQTAIKNYADAHVDADMRTDFIDISMNIYKQFQLENVN